MRSCTQISSVVDQSRLDYPFSPYWVRSPYQIPFLYYTRTDGNPSRQSRYDLPGVPVEAEIYAIG